MTIEIPVSQIGVLNQQRSGYVQHVCLSVYEQVNVAGQGFYNVMVCNENTSNSSGLVGVAFTGKAVFIDPFSPAAFNVFVFQSGVFVNTGDGGFINWTFEGKFTRTGDQGHTVTFTQ